MSDAPVRIGVGLDMDYLIFSAMSASETEIDWGDDVWTLQCDHKKARGILAGTIKSIMADLERILKKGNKKPFELVPLCIISGEENWRKKVLESYKANRKGKRKPVGYPAFVEACMEFYGAAQAFKWHGVEGDDTLGILSTKPEIANCARVIIVSCDKDFKTIPGMFYWLTNMEFLRLTEHEADYWHMYQTLIGDTTDGYTGIPGIGPETAVEFLEAPKLYLPDIKVMSRGPRKGQEIPIWREATLEEYNERQPTLWDCMVSLAASKEMTEAELLVQAQVARILRASDWDFEKSEPILWQPPQ